MSGVMERILFKYILLYLLSICVLACTAVSFMCITVEQRRVMLLIH